MSIQELERILASDLNIAHYYLLSIINFKGDIDSQNTLINGWINALIKRNLIISVNGEYELTESGKEQLFNITQDVPSSIYVIQSPTLPIRKTIEPSLEQFCSTLHIKIVNKIKELTGKTNLRNPSGKMLNSSVVELYDRLTSFFKKYKNVDAPYDKIERVILKYVEETCTGTTRYAVRILFFIWNEKNGGKVSEMLERIENLDDDDKTEIKKETINTKELF